MRNVEWGPSERYEGLSPFQYSNQFVLMSIKVRTNRTNARGVARAFEYDGNSMNLYVFHWQYGDLYRQRATNVETSTRY